MCANQINQQLAACCPEAGDCCVRKESKPKPAEDLPTLNFISAMFARSADDQFLFLREFGL